jgi:outer membrane protein assembly factor BamD
MLKRFTSVIGLGVMLFSFAACHNKRVTNPIAQVDSKQPDKILFDRAMDAMKHNKFDVARLTLQTLINTYPDSEFVARAKLAVGDSWYAEGGSAAMTQAENEYKDFITFFPNMPEAAEAQLKIANIHYREMEKPDRDFTHAKRAEDEYRQLLIQFPDSKLVPEAKQRLLQVQEVLAEREFRIGKFYFMRESWNAAIARLQSLADNYPLYSGADETLFMIGQAREHEADAVRALPGDKVNEVMKGRMIKVYEDQAAEAYDRLVKRYPVMPRAGEAKTRLEALHRPVPTPTPDAVALNKKEIESRGETGMWDRVMANLHKGPETSVAQATKVGEPPLVDAKPTNAPELLKQSAEQLNAAVAGTASGSGRVSVETLKNGSPVPNQPVPRSDNTAAPATNNDNGVPELQPVPDASQSEVSAQPVAPPTQVNEVQQQGQQPASPDSSSSSSSSAATAPAVADSASQGGASQQKTDDKQPEYSTSKKKQKKGLRKIVPF